MKNIAVIIILAVLCSVSYGSTSGDSLAIGRKCKIVLYYGFQAEGEIVKRSADTVKLQTDVTLLTIPVKDIKFVLNPDIELEEFEETSLPIEETPLITNIKQDTSVECELFVNNEIGLKDINLVLVNDSTLYAFKDGRSKLIDINGVKKIVFKSGSNFGTGYLYGSIAGFILGFFPFAFAKGGGHPDISGPGVGLLAGLLLSIPTGLVGGVIGALAATDEVILFDKGITPAKIKKIKRLIATHPK